MSSVCQKMSRFADRENARRLLDSSRGSPLKYGTDGGERRIRCTWLEAEPSAMYGYNMPVVFAESANVPDNLVSGS